MARKFQWYFCNLILALIVTVSCSAPEAGARGVATSVTAAPVATAESTAEVLPTIIPRSGDLIFVEFFAIT